MNMMGQTGNMNQFCKQIDLCLFGLAAKNSVRQTINPKPAIKKRVFCCLKFKPSGAFFFIVLPNYAPMLKNVLKGAFSALARHFFAQSADGFIQCVYFIHLVYSPCPFLPMPSHYWISVAIYTKGNASVLQPLFVMVGFAWALRFAY